MQAEEARTTQLEELRTELESAHAATVAVELETTRLEVQEQEREVWHIGTRRHVCCSLFTSKLDFMLDLVAGEGASGAAACQG